MNYVLDDLNNKLNIKIVPVTVLPFGKKKATNENKTLSSNVTLLARMDSGKFMRQVSVKPQQNKVRLIVSKRLSHLYLTYFKY